jgi:hypothetical protein
MTTYSPKEITRLLVAWGDGDESALADLTPLVYEELHRLAHHYMSGERAGHTLQTTALVKRGLRSVDRLEEHALAELRALLRRLGAVDAPHPG